MERPKRFRSDVMFAALMLYFLASGTFCTAAKQSPLWQEQPASPSTSIHQGLDIFMSLAEKLSPAVVNISIEQKTKPGEERPFRGFRGPSRERPPFGNDPFRDFFDRFFGDAPPQARQSLGSGFIIHPSGLILTNHHVIEEADKIKIVLQDERELEADVLGSDPKTDLALLQVKTTITLPTVPLGDSTKLRIGEWVMAIGNPFGLSHTVTAGIVSAKGRVIGAGQYDDFIQTDASINPGNSGGPLFNTRGEVVGINTAIIAGGTGIGFATPINLVKELLPQLHKQGKVTRGWIGVVIQKVTPELARTFALPKAEGALVADVMTEGPAALGGIKQGDIITTFDGSTIQNWHDLPRVVASTDVGKAVVVDVLRQGKAKTLKVTIAPMRDEAPTEAETSSLTGQLGMIVEELTPDLADRMGLSNTQGVFVAEVAPASLAAEAGLRQGDVILEVNRYSVTNTLDYAEALQNRADDTILLLVARDDNTLYIALKQALR
ncbi:MAG: DegQ family serine endoprotease [Gammaproteobacteria bacterium]|nr:DegQ family serine endoprotease [Gammaproteobacteria bacterium]